MYTLCIFVSYVQSVRYTAKHIKYSTKSTSVTKVITMKNTSGGTPQLKVLRPSLLRAKSANLVLPCDGFLYVTEIIGIFIVATLIADML